MSSKRTAILLSVLLAAALLIPASLLPTAARGAPAAAAVAIQLAPLSAETAVPPFPAEARLAEADGAEDLTQGDWWTDVQEDISRSEYNIMWQEQTGLPDPPAPSSNGATDEDVPQAAGLRVGGREPQSSGLRYSPVSGASAYQAPNRAHNLRTTFTGDGITVVPRTELTPAWSLSLALTGYGEAQPTVAGNRVEYARGALTEWYVNDEAGLHHGMRITTGQAGSPLVIQLAVAGDLNPVIGQESRAVEFLDASGQPVLRYGPLAVRDEDGNELAYTLTSGPTPWQGEGNIEITVAPGSAFPVRLEAAFTAGASSEPAGLAPAPNWMTLGGQAEARMGRAATGAGDVNGDGYDDLLVGVEQYDNGQVDEGRVYLFYGSATSLSPTPNWTAESNTAGAKFGYSASTAGDVNGDGFADVIVGAPGCGNGEASECRVYLYFGSASGLGAGAAWTWESNQVGDALGQAVGAAGDVNGDGYSDVLIGAPHHDSGQVDEGKAFAFYGSPAGLGSTPNWTAEADQDGAQFGFDTSTAGDVNGDGYADVIIGAPYYGNGQTVEGRAFLYLGSSSGLESVASWTAESDQGGAIFGVSASTAGDVNGDGYADVVVGSYGYDHGEPDEGAAFVYLGSASGLASAPAWMAEGDQSDAYFGRFSTTAGDVNGDGYADLLVAAPTYTAREFHEGRAYVYYGSAAGLQSTPAWTAEGNQYEALFGYSGPGHAGDVNGDGYADIAVGAFGYRSSQTDEGAAFVYHGGPDGLSATANWTTDGGHQYRARYGIIASAGDVNGDGYADVVVGEPECDGDQPDEGRAYVYYGSAAGLSRTASWTAEGGQAGAWFGWSVGTAGDVNNDGYDDLVVGAVQYDYGQTDEGRAFVFYGSANGLSASADWTAESDQETALFGIAAGMAGDVNGDGYADLVVGAFQYDNGQTDEGRVFVFYGSVNGLNTIPDWTVEGDQAWAYFGRSAATAGDVNGDGYADVVVGAYGYDNDQTNEGRAYVFYGSPGGLSTTPNWTVESDQAGAHLGHDVGTAGDVNGDGFADLAVGSIDYDHGQANEGRGRAFVYYGSATGLNTTADWTAEGDQDGARFSYPVVTAGDVNGDGYADLAVDAPYYDNGQTDEGRAFVYLGSANGLSLTPNWTAESNKTDAGLYPVGTAGDVNGDGYVDLVVGAINYSSVQWRDGRAFVYYGNLGGLSLRPQQRRSDNSAPVAHLGQSEQPDRFRLALLGRTPFGRGRVKLEWEIKPRGVPFDGTDLQRSADWVDTGTAGAQLDELAGGLSADTLYHWRVRLLYHPATTPFQQYSRWITNPWNGWNEARLRTGAGTPPTPTPTATATPTETPTATPAPTATPTETPSPAPTTCAIAGTIWLDADGDATRDSGEPGIAGVQVCAEPLGHRATRCATSGEDGSFTIELDAAGTYLVAPSAAPAGMQLTTKGFRLPVVVREGQQVQDVNFGYR